MIEKLPETKKRNGYLYTLVKRTDNVAMYEQLNLRSKTKVGYEVFKVTTSKEFTLKNDCDKTGKIYKYPSKEKYPGNEDFGKIAWTYSSLENANKKFEELCKGKKS